MGRKKICILSNGLARGGTDTFIVNLVRELDKQKYDITVVNSSVKPEKNVRELEVLEQGVKLIKTTDVDSFKGKVLHSIALYKILKTGKFDVFQTNIDLFNGPQLFIAWLAGVKIRVCHSHNSSQQMELIYGRRFAIVLYQSVMRWLCWHFSNRRCGCSEEAMKFLFKNHKWRQNNYPFVINNGISISSFRSGTDKAEKKRALGLFAKLNIVTVGKMAAQKNPLFLVDIFAELCKLRDDCDLVWAGVGDMESDVKRRIASYGICHRVHLLGSRNDVNEILQCGDAFLLPSSFEGLGIVMIEAQAAGLPCVASNAVPPLANCGAACYLSLSEPATVWANTLLDILDGRIRLTVDEEKLESFSISNMVKQIEAVFV